MTDDAAMRRLLIILMNTDPRNPEELGAPFYYAAVAAAMDHQVDVLCTATAGKLMLKGVAAAIRLKPGEPKTVYDWIKEAHGRDPIHPNGVGHAIMAEAFLKQWPTIQAQVKGK